MRVVSKKNAVDYILALRCASRKHAKDFVENGNVRNSVNYPAVSLGAKKGPRVAVCHLASATLPLAGATECVTKTRGDVAYTLAEGPVDVEAVKAAAGVLKVRVIA